MKPRVMTCDCDEKHAMGIEYDMLHPEYYDGVSEWYCQKCGKRWGRWSGKELAKGESEPRFGIKDRAYKISPDL